MSRVVSLKIKAHDNIYMKKLNQEQAEERELYLEMGIPENGINENTGLLVLIPGYGGEMESNIYTKMRREFSDRYNMVVMQCNYFGNHFMSEPLFLETARKLCADPEVAEIHLKYSKETEETLQEFNDMGIMQAVDIVTATLYCLQYIREKETSMLNTKKVMLFGSSHGAYLAHLANIICPQLYTYIIDVSSYIFPYYLTHERIWKTDGDKRNVEIITKCFLTQHQELQYSKKLYDLEFLYQNSKNTCKIIAFQGTQDWMVDYKEKESFIKGIGETAQLMLIDTKDVDGVLCKNASHGLGMDFVELFQMLMPLLDKQIQEYSSNINIPEVVRVGDRFACFEISYCAGLPVIEHVTFVEKKIEEHFFEHIFLNLPYYCNGYSVCSLNKILSADTLLVIAHGNLTENEAKILKTVRTKLCIMASRTALDSLNKAGICPDFIFLEPFLEISADLEADYKGCEQAALIAGMETDVKWMSGSKGAKFLYWTGNKLERLLWKQGKQASAQIYQYNKLMQLDFSGGIVAAMKNVGTWMGATEIMVVGDKAGTEGRLDQGVINADKKIEDLQKIYEEDINIDSVLAELNPYFDAQGKQIFWQAYNDLEKIGNDIITNIMYGMQLYQDLYDTAMQNPVRVEEMQKITKELNEFTGELEQTAYIAELCDMLEVIPEEEEKVQSVENEVIRTAYAGILMLKKLEQVCRTMRNCVDLHSSMEASEGMEIRQRKHQKNILLAYGKSSYNVLPNFAKQLKKGFKKMGYQVFLADLRTDNSFVEGKNFYQNTVGFDNIILMNGVTLGDNFRDGVIGQERSWFDSGRHSHVTVLFFDHPIYHLGRLQYIHGHMNVVFFDTKNKAFLENYVPRVKNTFFVQMGGSEQIRDYDFEQKENKVVFFSSNSNLVKWEEFINKSKYATLAWRVINLLKQQVQLTIEEAFLIVGRENDCEYSVENILVQTDTFKLIDQYIRTYYKNQVIFTIAESGIPFDIYGWNSKELEKYPNVHQKSPVPVEQMEEICRKTRFVLNVNPWSKGGVQERIFNAMLGGSICITDVNEWLEGEFTDGENVLFYKLDHIEELPEKIRYYMENEELAKRVAEAGFHQAQERHTWAKRAEEMADMLGMERSV